MPSDAYLQEIREAFALAKVDETFLDTFEIQNPASTQAITQLDLTAIIDNTGSQQGNIATIRDVITDVAAEISEDFETIRFSLIQFKDEDETTLVTAGFVDLTTFQTEVDALTATGGGDGLENGYGAIVLAAGQDWDDSAATARAAVLITDVGSHERGATQAQALESLQTANVTFFYGFNGAYASDYDEFATETGGFKITTEVVSEVTESLSTALRGLKVSGGQDSIFIVNGFEDLELTLEDDTQQVFRAAAFRTADPTKDEQGFSDRPLTIDNTGREVSDFLERVSVHSPQIPIIHRGYLRSDLTAPQGVPFKLYLNKASAGIYEVAGLLSVSDVVNKPGSSFYFHRSRFPTMVS